MIGSPYIVVFVAVVLGFSASHILCLKLKKLEQLNTLTLAVNKTAQFSQETTGFSQRPRKLANYQYRNLYDNNILHKSKQNRKSAVTPPSLTVLWSSEEPRLPSLLSCNEAPAPLLLGMVLWIAE
jgi:hypothetical protein